jgi:hypothetical protein
MGAPDLSGRRREREGEQEAVVDGSVEARRIPSEPHQMPRRVAHLTAHRVSAERFEGGVDPQAQPVGPLGGPHEDLERLGGVGEVEPGTGRGIDDGERSPLDAQERERSTGRAGPHDLEQKSRLGRSAVGGQVDFDPQGFEVPRAGLVRLAPPDAGERVAGPVQVRGQQPRPLVERREWRRCGVAVRRPSEEQRAQHRAREARPGRHGLTWIRTEPPTNRQSETGRLPSARALAVRAGTSTRPSPSPITAKRTRRAG